MHSFFFKTQHFVLRKIVDETLVILIASYLITKVVLRAIKLPTSGKVKCKKRVNKTGSKIIPIFEEMLIQIQTGH